jgi:antitoxin VapB
MLQHMPQDASMIPERHVKLFRNGRNQAVRIPREFVLPGEDAVMRKAQPTSLLGLLATLEPLDEDFPDIDDLPPDPVDL